MQTALNARIGRTLPAPFARAVAGRRRADPDRRGRRDRWRAGLTPVVATFFVGAALFAGALSLADRPPRPVAHEPVEERTAPVAWPTHFRGRPLIPLPPGELEDFFARRFDGPIARFTDGRHVVILRHAARPTRQLHTAEAALRAMGYGIDGRRLTADDHGQRWTCFVATRDDLRMRACERIHDGGNGEWTDPAAWFWASQYGGGPWWAVTLLSPTERQP